MDQIIEVGFWRFEGLKLVDKYQSLVHLPHDLAPALTRLTGITSKQLKKAPRWEEVVPHVQELAGHTLLAHNADFEKSFLSSSFEKIERSRWGDIPTSFVDSLMLFPLLDPKLSQLSLETILRNYKLKETEDHRALEDSRDMLRCLLRAKIICSHHPGHEKLLNDWLAIKGLDTSWYGQFLGLGREQIEALASAIDMSEQELMGMPTEIEKKSDNPSSSRIFPQKFTGQDLEDFFHKDEEIRKFYPHYQVRDSQIQMAKRVGQCLKNHKHSLIQAPTGTGKTFGYLVPVLSFVEHCPDQVLIATGTKALQAQAMDKDLPELMKLFGKERTPKVVKLIGSSNHWCEMLVRSQSQNLSSIGDITSGPDLLSSTHFADHLFDLYLEVIFFYHDQGQFFTREDFPFVLKTKIKNLSERERAVAVDYRSCLASRCPYRNRCGYIDGLQKAREANVIVGNHSLMLQWPKSQERPQFIIVDEAHRLENEATKSLTLTVNQSGLEYLFSQIDHAQGIGALFYLLAKKKDSQATDLIQQIRQEMLDWVTIAREHWDSIKEQAAVWFRQTPRYSEMYWNERPFPLVGHENAPLHQALANRLISLGETLGQMVQVLLPHGAWAEIQDWKSDEEKLAYGRFETFLAQLQDIHQVFTLSIKANPDYVHSLKFHQEFGVQLESAPLNVGKFLADSLFSQALGLALTSATLCAQDGSDARAVEWLTGHSALAPDRRFRGPMLLPPVFDYEKRAKVFLATNTPKMNDPHFVSSILESVLPIVRELKGKSLLLFSSKLRFDQAVDYLLKELGQELEIFIQGMGKTVVEDFKNSQAGVLIGMESFGEGIDVPGDGLQFLLIDKIPDLRQDLVIEKRRELFEREWGQEFRDYFLAHRTSSLHQKLGRLLRTPNDYGAAIIVDSRAQNWKGRTLNDFSQLMRPYQLVIGPISESVEGALNFLRSN